MFLNNLKSQSNKIFLFGAVLLFSTPFVINANNTEVKKIIMKVITSVF